MDALDRLRRRYVEAHLPGARWHQITVAGVCCEAFEAGHGPPLVLVHGGIGHATQWVPLMVELVADFRCVAVERPSNGASDELDHAAIAGTPRDHVTAVIGDLLDGVGLPHAPLVGNSLGGTYALGFATRHPERVDHVVLAGAPAAHDVPVPLPVRLLGGALTGPMVRPMLRRATAASTRRNDGRLLVAHPERLDHDLLELSAATTRHNADAWPRAMRWTVKGRAIRRDMPSTTWALEAATAGVPLTYLWGERDRFVPAAHGREVARQVGAGFVLVEDAGHLLWLDRPVYVAEQLRRALTPS